MKVCALDLEMNQKYPLAIGLALDSKAGKLICIDQEGKTPDWYIRKYIVTDKKLWEGTTKCKDALEDLLELTKDYDVIYTWGKELRLLFKLGVAAYGCNNFPNEFIHMCNKLTNVQPLVENPAKLQVTYARYFEDADTIDWHNPLGDAIATLKIAILVKQSEKGID